MALLSESPAKARFFKVMMPGFHTKLRLPPAFCKKLKEEIPELAFLTSCKGTWRVEIGQCSRGRICFENGWKDFVENHDLKFGEFVLFEQIAHMHFKASVFDSTTCEKEFLLEVREKEECSSLNVDDLPPKAKRGRGRPRKRAVSLQQKEFPVEIHEEEANIGTKVDEHAKAAKSKCNNEGGRGRPRMRAPFLQQKEFPMEEIHEAEAPFGRNHYDHAIQKKGRGRPRKRTASFQRKNLHLVRKTTPYNTNHDSPFEKEFSVGINEAKEPLGKNVHDHAVQTRGIPSDGAVSPRWKQSNFVQRIMPYNISHCSLGVHIPRIISEAYHMSEKTRISLRGPSGEWHELKLTHHCKDRLCMKIGWREFCTSNKIEQGDVCIFQITCKDTQESSKTVMMDVKVLGLS